MAEPDPHWLYRLAHWWTTHIPYVHDPHQATAWMEDPPPPPPPEETDGDQRTP